MIRAVIQMGFIASALFHLIFVYSELQ